MRRLPLLLLCMLAAAPALAGPPPPSAYAHQHHRRIDSLFVEARQLAVGARTVRQLAARSVPPHGLGRHDRRGRLALEALYRLEGQSVQFAALVADPRARPVHIDRAYQELVRDFRLAWRLVVELPPHGALHLELARLEARMARIDDRYFGSWGLRGGDADWRSGRRQYDDRDRHGRGGYDDHDSHGDKRGDSHRDDNDNDDDRDEDRGDEDRGDDDWRARGGGEDWPDRR